MWVCDAVVRPSIDGDGPQPPWILAGAIAREEKGFIEAIQRLQNTRDAHARTVDFQLQVHNRAVALARSGAKPGTVTFEPDGLWVVVDISGDRPRFVAFTQRVRATTHTRRAPDARSGQARRPLATIPLRARARSGASALEWAFRAPRD